VVLSHRVTVLRPITIDPVLLPRLAIWAVLVGILSYTVADPDLWGHVRFGMDILNQRELPVQDPYSFTSDRPWVNPEWLAEVVMAGAIFGSGPIGLVALKLLLLGSAFLLIHRELAAPRLAPIAQDVLLAICVISCLALTTTLGRRRSRSCSSSA
jgi:hypothetical protein